MLIEIEVRCGDVVSNVKWLSCQCHIALKKNDVKSLSVEGCNGGPALVETLPSYDE